MFFSPSTLGFYDPLVGPVPQDAVAITRVKYESLMAAQAQGLKIESSNGQPVSVPQVATLEDWRNTCEVTRRQAIIALYNTDNGTTLAAVQAAVDAAGGVVKIEWENALTFKRNNSTVAALANTLGWNASQLDALFQAAQQVAD